jgi:hypothetical protein
MRVKIDSVIKWIVILAIASALSLFKPLGVIASIFYFEYAVRWSMVLLAMVTCVLLIYKKKIENKYLIFISCFVVCLVLTRLFLDLIAGRNVYKELNANSTYFFILFAFPVYYLLKYRIITLNKLLDMIIFLTTLSYFLRLYISAYYSFFHQRIFYPISIESASEKWFRNGVLRINPPCFGLIIIALCLYQFYSAKKLRRRIYYGMVIVLSVYYSAFIHYSRAVLIYQISELIFLIYIKRKRALKQVMLNLFLGSVGVILLINGYFDKLLDLFSIQNAEYWFSNTSRMIAYPYYFGVFLNNIWMGIGLLLGDELYFASNNVTGALSDVGALRSLVQLGAGMFIFYASFFINGFMTGAKLQIKGNDQNLVILVWGITISVFLTCINIDCFFPVYVFSVPFCMAIIEYIRVIDGMIYR